MQDQIKKMNLEVYDGKNEKKGDGALFEHNDGVQFGTWFFNGKHLRIRGHCIL